MAQVKTLKGEKILIQIESADSPGIYAHPCQINGARAAQLSSDVNEFIVPDCDTPGTPAFKEILKDGISLQVTGGGMVHTTDIELWMNWMLSDDAKNVRVNFDTTLALGGGYLACAMKVTQFNIAGDRKQNSTVDITMMSHGVIAWVDALV